MNKKLVSVIIVNYNGKEVLEKCVQSVFSSAYSHLEVIVVDNGSNDGSAEEISKKFDVTLIRNKRNLGYCAGNNKGIDKAKGEYVLLLNYDTILHRAAISRLVEEASRSQTEFYQPKILMLNNPRIINSTGISIHLAGFGLLRGSGEEDFGQYDKREEICAAHGACIFASKSALQEVGFLDESFFAFNDDTDLGWRALLKGKKTKYVPTAIVYHKWGHAWDKTRSVTKIYFAERNRLIMILSNYQRSTFILLLPIFVLAELSTWAYCTVNRMLQAKVKEYADLIQMRRYIIRRRKWIQSIRKIDDKNVLNHFTCEFKHAYLAKHVKPLNILFNLLCNRPLYRNQRH